MSTADETIGTSTDATEAATTDTAPTSTPADVSAPADVITLWAVDGDDSPPTVYHGSFDAAIAAIRASAEGATEEEPYHFAIWPQRFSKSDFEALPEAY